MSKNEKTALFRDLVNDIMDILQLANDRMGALRDAVNSEQEKEVYNHSREVLQTDLLPAWRKYRNELPAGVGNKSMGTGWIRHCKLDKLDEYDRING